MRALTLAILVMCSSVFADETTNAQDNTSIASPSSTMSNVQVNNDVMAESSYGGGVRCSDPTMNVSATRTPHNGNYYTASVSFPLNSAFQTSDCEKAARTQNRINNWRLTEMQYEAERKEEYHVARMEQEYLKVAEMQSRLLDTCMKLHNEMSGNPRSEIWNLCSNFAPISEPHHTKPINKNLIPATHERFSANELDR